MMFMYEIKTEQLIFVRLLMILQLPKMLLLQLHHQKQMLVVLVETTVLFPWLLQMVLHLMNIVLTMVLRIKPQQVLMVFLLQHIV